MKEVAISELMGKKYNFKKIEIFC